MDEREVRKYVDAVFGVVWKQIIRESGGPSEDLSWGSVFDDAALKPCCISAGRELEFGQDLNSLDAISVNETRNNFRFTFARDNFESKNRRWDIWVNDVSILHILDNPELDAGFRAEIFEILRDIGARKV